MTVVNVKISVPKDEDAQKLLELLKEDWEDIKCEILDVKTDNVPVAK